MTTFLFHDYETYGLNTRKTRVSQFAAIRTDEDLNIIEEEKYDLMSIPPIDFVPSPEACLVTGITPFSIKDSGKPNLNDYELFSTIHRLFNKPGTCSIGYNSLQFDDEITRNGFYRNLLPIYTREFKSDCSRFDLINMLREFAFLYPDDIKIPKDENGAAIFKLDTLAPLNGFSENSYHDAFTDVKATIYMAKLIKEKQPDYWKFRISNYKKQSVINYINQNSKLPLFYTSSTNGGDSKFVEPIFIVAHSYPDNNSYVGVKLSDIDKLKEVLTIPLPEIKSRLYMKNHELEECGLSRLPLVKIAANKLPILTSYLDDAELLNITKIDKPLSEINENLKFVQANINEFRRAGMAAYQQDNFTVDNKNADLKIYGGFISRTDEYVAASFHDDLVRKNYAKYIVGNEFGDPKLNDLARKVIFRNFSHDIINNPELSGHYATFLRRAYSVVKSGFDPIYEYEETEVKNDNFMENDKMVEFTLTEIRDVIKELTEKYIEDAPKSKIINEFRQSLNDLVNNFKLQNEILTKKEGNENKNNLKTKQPPARPKI